MHPELFKTSGKLFPAQKNLFFAELSKRNFIFCIFSFFWEILVFRQHARHFLRIWPHKMLLAPHQYLTEKRKLEKLEISLRQFCKEYIFGAGNDFLDVLNDSGWFGKGNWCSWPCFASPVSAIVRKFFWEPKCAGSVSANVRKFLGKTTFQKIPTKKFSAVIF